MVCKDSAVKVYYAKLNNMGDLLSEYLIPQITSRKVIHCENVAQFQVMGVGSCGGAIWGNKNCGYGEKAKDCIKRIACSNNEGRCAIWGTGFLKDFYPRKLELIRKNTSFIAVRGALSKRIIENSIGRSISPVLCDGGILAAELIKEKVQKKYSVGFIPHYNEQLFVQTNGIKSYFLDKYKKAIVIDLRDNPIDVIKTIGECEFIISSSLHGCVVADSFGIPNVRIAMSSIPGSGFKFDDYYSAYNLEVPAISVIKGDDLPELTYIDAHYMITRDMVEQKKREMSECLANFVLSLD